MTISNPTYILLVAHGVPHETRGRVWKTFFFSFFQKGGGAYETRYDMGVGVNFKRGMA